MFRLFAACAPGLEPWLRDELTEIGVDASTTTVGGVSFEADGERLYRVALCSGLALGIRVRLGAFVARRFEQVVRNVAALEWRRWLPAHEAVDVKVTAKKSRLYHTTAVADRVREGLRRALGPPVNDSEHAPWTVHVRLVNDECTVSLDVTGAPMYQRDYRLATAKAPLRPDLAFALLRVAGWRGDQALVDPFCGAGTLCIEAAALAQGLPPGRLRRFAFMRSPRFEPTTWARIKTAAMNEARPRPCVPIIGTDRDAGAVQAAADNARRAGVEVEWQQAALGRSAAVRQPPGDCGLWVSNPPYGHRIGDGAKLRHLYQRIGVLKREMPSGWRLALVVASPALARATAVPLESVVMTDHGGTKVRLMVEPLKTSTGAET